MNQPSLTRREFNGLCAALGSSLSAAGGMMAALFNASALAAAARTVKFRDGTIVPALGQGSWHLAQEDIRKPLRKKRCAQAFRSG